MKFHLPLPSRRPVPTAESPAKAVWRLVVRDEALECRFDLRSGMLVELAEEA